MQTMWLQLSCTKIKSSLTCLTPHVSSCYTAQFEGSRLLFVFLVNRIQVENFEAELSNFGLFSPDCSFSMDIHTMEDHLSSLIDVTQHPL